MNVDIDNFSEVRQLIKTQKLIQKSELISFDLEFAGLKFQGNDRDRSEYLPAEKYQKMAAVARKYCIMQVGVTFFIPAQKSEQIVAHPFNFYIFPRPTMYSDPTIAMQSGCVSFNIGHKMDWNRWVQKGITYMKLTQYERINDIQDKAKKYQILLNYLQEQNKSVVKQVIKDIKNQQQKSKQQPKLADQENKWYQLPISSFNYTRKVIEKYFEQQDKLYTLKYSDEELKNREEDTIEFQVIRITKEEKQKIDKKKMEQLFGFTLLFEQIWNSGKPFVGHNFFFDILFIYQAFIAALPYDYQLFKKSVTQLKSQNTDPSEKMVAEQQKKRTFYDTKLICNNLNHKFQYFQDSTTLQKIYRTFLSKNLSKKTVTLPKEYERYELKNQVLHEAGFDSYLTGWIYYQIKQLASNDGLNIAEQFKGRVNLNRSYFYVNFDQFYDGVCEYVIFFVFQQRVFYIQVVDPNKYAQIEYIKTQRYNILKSIKQILNEQNITKDVLLHEGLKQVFIEIKQSKNYNKITAILVKCLKQKKMKDLYSLNNFLISKNAKQWADTFSKAGNNGP